MNLLRLLSISLALTVLLACANSGRAQPEETSASYPSAERIIAVGDVHGDFDQFKTLLTQLGLIDKKRNWSGGNTHLVQLGDLPDRGPDTRKVMDMLIDLQEQAPKDGGAVTVLIGNHDAMMMIGDLRYVHPGEYAAFKDRNSRKRRAAYYQQTLDHIKTNLPEEEWPEFNREYKKNWEARFPLGYVEHRIAWAPTGEYGKWTLSRPAVAKVGDSLFVHGGLSSAYADLPISSINTKVRTALAMGERISEDSIVEDSEGPLWHRGWVRGLQNQETASALQTVLDNYGVNRMVVGHTPVASVIIPRFGGKLLVTDVGLSAHYGSGAAVLEIIEGKASMMLMNGDKLALPNSEEGVDAYFDAAQIISDQPEKIVRYRKLLKKEQEQAEAQAEAAPAVSNP